jgi:hypothetical protein
MELSANLANLIFTYNVTTPNAGIATSEFSRTINLRNIIGSQEYDKSEFFEMSFNNYSASNFLETIFTNEIGALSSSNALKLGVSGLPFVSNSLNGQVSNFALFSQVFQATGHPSALNSTFRGNNFPYPRQRSIKFRKPANPEVTLTFAFYTVRGPSGIVFFRTGTAGTPVNVSQVLCFSILPCKN